MSQFKTCTECGHRGNMFTDFEDWDKLCKSCRADAGPMTFEVRSSTDGLTKWQEKILELRLQGLTQLQIARELSTTDLAIRQQLVNIRGKGFEVPYEEELVAV